MLPLLLACASPEPATTSQDTDPTIEAGETGDDTAGDTGGGDSGGDSGGETGDTGGDTGAAANRWNVLVYMDGDNSLESYVTHDLNELEQAGSGDGVTILVQADRIDGYDTSDGDWTGTRRYLITADGDTGVVTSAVLEDLGEVDMGDPATLADFLAWADEHYPAEHTLLSLWDHGDGWTATAPPPSIASDDTTGSVISVAEGDLRAALQPHVDAVGPLDVIAFDACYMASWEVADSLRGQARVMVASEAWVGNDGIMYAPLVRRLREDPTLSGADLAATMAEDSVYEGREMTYSAIDIDAVGALTERIDALAGWGLTSEDHVQALLDARAASRGADADWGDWYHDLGDLSDAVASAGGDEGLGADARAALDSAVIAAHGDEDYDWTGGLTILFGTFSASALETYQTAPGATWSQETRWDDYLIAANALERGSSAR